MPYGSAIGLLPTFVPGFAPPPQFDLSQYDDLEDQIREEAAVGRPAAMDDGMGAGFLPEQPVFQPKQPRFDLSQYDDLEESIRQEAESKSAADSMSVMQALWTDQRSGLPYIAKSQPFPIDKESNELDALRREVEGRIKKNGTLLDPKFVGKFSRIEELKGKLRKKYPAASMLKTFQDFDKETRRWFDKTQRRVRTVQRNDLAATREQNAYATQGHEVGGLASGLLQGGSGLARPFLQGVETGLTTVGATDMAEGVGRFREFETGRVDAIAAAQSQAVADKKYGWARRNLNEAIPDVAASLSQAIAVSPAGLAGMAGAFGVIQGSEAYDDARKSGLNNKESLKYAAVQGSIEAGVMLTFNKLGSLVPGMAGLEGKLQEALVGKITRESLKAGSKRIAIEVGSETLEELITAAAEQTHRAMTILGAEDEGSWRDKNGNVTLDSPMAKTLVRVLRSTWMMMGVTEGTQQAQKAYRRYTANPTEENHRKAVAAGMPSDPSPVDEPKTGPGNADTETDELESQLLRFAEMEIPSRKLLESPDVVQYLVDGMPQFERVRGIEDDGERMAEAGRLLKSSNNRRKAQEWLRRDLTRLGVADFSKTGEGVIPDGEGQEETAEGVLDTSGDPAAGADDGSAPASERDETGAADAAVKAEFAGYNDRQLELASERLSQGEDERSQTVLGFVRAEQEKRKASSTTSGKRSDAVAGEAAVSADSTGSSTPVETAPEPVVKPGTIRVEPAATAPADQAPAAVDSGNGPTKVGTRQSLAGRGEQEAVEVVRGEDGVDYELWKDVNGRGGVLRTVDVDSGKVVEITSGPSFSGLKGKFDAAVKTASVKGKKQGSPNEKAADSGESTKALYPSGDSPRESAANPTVAKQSAEDKRLAPYIEKLKKDYPPDYFDAEDDGVSYEDRIRAIAVRDADEKEASDEEKRLKDMTAEQRVRENGGDSWDRRDVAQERFTEYGIEPLHLSEGSTYFEVGGTKVRFSDHDPSSGREAEFGSATVDVNTGDSARDSTDAVKADPDSIRSVVDGIVKKYAPEKFKARQSSAAAPPKKQGSPSENPVEQQKPAFDWASAKTGDILPDGRKLVIRGVRKKADAKDIAARSGGEVMIDGPGTWAVAALVKAESPVAESPKPEESPIKAAIRAEMEKNKAEKEAASKPKEPGKLVVQDLRSGTKTDIPESKPRKDGSPRSKLGQKTEQAVQNAEERTKAALEKWKQEMGDLGVLSLPGVNMKAVMATVELTGSLIAEGTVKFADFVVKVSEVVGAATARKLEEYLVAAWEISGETNPKLDAAGKVADVLGPEQKATVDDDGRKAPGSASDESVGGVPGESGGALASEAGKLPEDGKAEGVSGRNGGSVSDGTDGTAGTGTGSSGVGVAGDGSGESSGAESKPGRDPDVAAGGASVVGVQGAVARNLNNLRIQPSDTVAPNGAVGKLRANVAAIKLLKSLESEGRAATDDEKRVLMQYTGWGSLANAFDEYRGEAYLAQPGLASVYGEWYKKAQMYQQKGQYLSEDQLRKRVESWEKQWGEAYKFLKENLTADEWKSAAASTANAHFTSRTVVTHGIWDALERMGVTGGRFLEPSAGVGNLIGLMPELVANNSEVIAVELDSLTGRMLEKLYPDASVYVRGLENTALPANSIDLAATNVPFAQTGPQDAETRYGRAMNLHNYFIARILDALRPGGIAAVISTHHTMDSNSQDREFLATKGDLIGAIRLPNNAFQQNAGTEVTTDILFFRKPDGSPFVPAAWVNLATVGEDEVIEKGKKKRVPIVANQYFAEHPEMVLGTHSLAGEMYGTADSRTEYTLEPVEGADLAAQLKKAVGNLPQNLVTQDTGTPMPSMDVGTSGVEGRIDLHGGKLLEFVGKEWVTPAWLRDSVELVKDGSKKKKLSPETLAKKLGEAVKQATGYVKVRNAYEKHLANMLDKGTSEADYKASQKALNDSYDSYRKLFGEINYKDSRWLERDPGFFLTSGLEIEKETLKDGKREATWAKADVFRERTIQTVAPPTNADSVEEAVKLSLAWHGRLNLPWMSELTGTSSDQIRVELLSSGVVFENPETGLLEPGDTYLAGNVHAKLRVAEQSVKDGNQDHAKNVESLKAIQPNKVTIDVITPSLGAPWIPEPLVNRWIHERIGMAEVGVKYNEKADIWSVLGSWYVPQDIQNNWATAAVKLGDLLSQVINGQSTRVMKEEDNGFDSSGRPKTKLVVDDKETQAAGAKAEKLRRDFEQWIKSDEAAIRELEQAYNEQKNFYVKPKWDGAHMTYPGMAPEWQKRMRPYQKNSVWRAIREGRGMIAHGVGAGKTLELIATAMEMKRLGTAKKPMVVVQNSTLGQFARTFTQVYPTAKVLVAGPEDLNKRNRAKFMARIASGNWDAVVMAKSSFNDKLPNDPLREKEMIEGLIEELKAVAREYAASEGDKSPSVKAIQKQIKALEKRLSAILDRLKERNDDDVFFEQLGVDALFLDEAHDYKKPPFVTKLDKNIKGITTEVSGRALSALVKMRFIQGSHGGKNTFMATGTPITNTLGEAWLLMNMVAPDVNKEFGVETFDRFVALFAKVGESDEQNSVGKWVRRTRLARFKNGHQLGQFIASGWDVLLGAPLHDQIREYGGGSVPKLANGKETLHMVERSPAFDRFHKFLVEVFDAYSGLSGEDKRNYSWVPVTIYGAAKAAAIDIRLIDPTAPDDPGSKVNLIVKEAAKSFHEGTDRKLTQLIFSDVKNRSTMDKLRAFAARQAVVLERAEDEDIDEDADEDGSPANAAEDGDSWLYREIKRKLVAEGVPEDQVQLIEDHRKTPAALLAFQDKVNAGEVRIVIGHSDTLGTGVNVQERLEQTWELDIPMVPYKREQRLGRMIRSGNTNEIVKANVLGMKQSLDGPLMELNLRKSKFAEQALMGKLGGEFEDPYSESLMSMEDMMAAMNDDPLFFRLRDLEFNIRGMKWEKEALDDQKSGQRESLRNNEQTIENIAKREATESKLADDVEEVLKSDQPIKVDGKEVAKADVEAVVRSAYKKESERISKAIQDSRLRPGTDNLAVDIEMGPIQFSILYSERPEVRQDDAGNPETHWVVSASTVATMNKQELFRGKMTTWPTILKEIVGKPAEIRGEFPRLKDISEKRKADNVKLREFLAKPYDRQIELENAETELAQTKALMVARDAGGKVPQGAAPAIPPMVSKAYNLATTSTVLRPGESRRPRKSGRPVAEVEDDDLSPRGMPMSSGKNPVSGRRVKMEVPYRTKPPAGVVIPQTAAGKVIQAVVDAAESLGAEIPLRVGLFRGKNIRGIYKTVARVARVRAAGDIVGATHELGHGMWSLLSSWNGTGIRPALSGPIRKELMGIAKALYPHGAPSGGYVEEGFADFVRQWVTDPKEAARHAPKMVAWWEGHFLPAMPDFKAKIEAAREQAKNYREQGAKALAGTQLVDTSSLKRRAEKAQQKAAGLFSNTSLWETLDPYWHVTAAAEELLGRKLSIEEDPYRTGKTLRMTQHAVVKSFVNDGIRTTDGHFLAAPLDDVGKSIPESEAVDFKLYLYGKRALALWQDPNGPRDPGIPEPIAQALVDEVENDPAKSARYQTAAQVVYDWNEGLLSYVSEFSPLFAESVNRIRARDPGYYVPLARDFDEIAGTIRSMGGSAAKGNLVAKLRGSGLPVKDMVPQMIANATRMVGLGHQRMVLEQLADLSKIPGMGKVIEEVEVKNIPAASRTIEDLVTEIEKRMAPGDSLGSEWQSVGDDVITFFAQAQHTPAGKPIIPMVVDEGGVKKLKWFYVREDLYHGLSGLDFGTPELSGWGQVAWKAFTLPTKIAKAGYVGYRASFGLVTNPLADLPTFLVNSRADKNAVGVFGEWVIQIGKSLAHVVTGGKYTTPEIEFWERMGGPMASSLGQESSETRAYAQDVFGHTLTERLMSPSKWGSVVADFADFFRDTIQFAENAPRLAEIKLLAQERGIDLSKPVPMNQAMELLLAGQEVTIDFREGGTMTRIANQVCPFLLAPFSGARAIGRAAQDHPWQFARRAALLGLAALALWWKNKDEEWWIEKDDQEKFRYYFFKVGNTIFKYPRRDIGLFTSVTEGLADAAYRRDASAMSGWMTSVFKGFMPSAPPVLEEPFEQALNKDLFTGMPIVPKTLEGKPAEEQHDEFTSRAAILLGSLFKQSPKRIDHMIRGFGGGVAADVVDAAGLGASGVERDWEASDTPVLGRLFQRGGTLGGNPKSVRQFYDKLGDFQKREKSELHPLTPFESQQNGMMEDARKALTTLSAARRVAKNGEDRDVITREMIRTSKEAMERVESGTLTDKRKASMVYEATSSLKGVLDKTVESRKEAKAAVRESGLTVDEQLSALRDHWIAEHQADEDRKAKISGKKPKKVMGLKFTTEAAAHAYKARQRAIRNGL